MFNVDGAITQLSKNISDSIAEREFLIVNKDIVETCQFKIVFHPKKTRVVIGDLCEIAEARRFMRSLFGSWNDRHGLVFECGEETIATWSDDNYHWEIWFECKTEEFRDKISPFLPLHDV